MWQHQRQRTLACVSVMAKILIADDRPSSREMLRCFLEASNHVVVDAADGAEALVLARQHQPQLIILDLYMPNMNGFDFMEAAQLDESIRSIPVVVLTASATRADRERATGVGFAAYLTKPVSLSELRQQVRQLIEKA